MQIKITSGKSYAVLGLDGAQLNSLVKNDTEYLWQGDEKYWSGQAPVCFPIAGVLPDGKANAFGKPCEMKRHGVARINPFEVYEAYENSVPSFSRAVKKQGHSFLLIMNLK